MLHVTCIAKLQIICKAILSILRLLPFSQLEFGVSCMHQEPVQPVYSISAGATRQLPILTLLELLASFPFLRC